MLRTEKNAANRSRRPRVRALFGRALVLALSVGFLATPLALMFALRTAGTYGPLTDEWGIFSVIVQQVASSTEGGNAITTLAALMWLAPMCVIAAWRLIVLFIVLAVEFEAQILSRREFWKDFLSIREHRREDLEAAPGSASEFAVLARYYATCPVDLLSVIAAAVYSCVPFVHAEEAE